MQYQRNKVKALMRRHFQLKVEGMVADANKDEPEGAYNDN
jgi:hypothetical protein